ncbi:5-(carboxyamino)imidazole ribonucleotide synthase [Alloscardovia theropitheci]|uniref:N5-carboxyaminoimidazole ribonucleotide synthase n=1 Tax=Alloscardovia theropitheci TaxID=2496842 RepID=A0A4R0QZ07_9BIFI|nr:5-(carboxyamino)imidazole ribonucleotide synthase [Alloscardovia theropitheci]TCD54961.1 5-(carboxyamino)imidazole ribonucleotide synthase [Alloscardovia theropitheci]
MPSLTSNSTSVNHSELTRLSRGATIGIIGGGQLGQMMALSARYMGFHTVVLDPTEECPAAGACDEQIVADYDDKEAIAAIAKRSDVLTYEFENVDADALDSVSDCVRIPQGTELLRVTQNRIAEKTFINNHGGMTAQWAEVTSADSLREAVQEIGLPAVLKTAEGGYDGHGQKVLRNDDDVEEAIKLWSTSDDGTGFPQSILEKMIGFAYEASILVSGNGLQFVTFPVVKNHHVHNILHTTVAPAFGAEPSDVDRLVEQRAQQMALDLAAGFNLAGTLALELFVMDNGEVLVNELAPRPHNSGHYTIEACDYDQFDLHIRGIAGWDMPQPQLLSPAVMINVLGQHLDQVMEYSAQHAHWHVHDYGKAVSKFNRKMGHVTVLGYDTDTLLREFEETGIWQ